MRAISHLYRITYVHKGVEQEYMVQGTTAQQARLRLLCLLPGIQIKQTLLLPYGMH